MRGVKAKSFKKEMDGIFEKIFSKDIQTIQMGMLAAQMKQNSDTQKNQKKILAMLEKQERGKEEKQKIKELKNTIQNLEYEQIRLEKKIRFERNREFLKQVEIEADDIDFNGFNNYLGKGGQGKVYKVKRGRLACAAKVFELGGLKEKAISTPPLVLWSSLFPNKMVPG